MKKAFILPSATGEGDLSVAITLADTLKHEFSVSTSYFAENAHFPLSASGNCAPGSHPPREPSDPELAV